MELSSAMSPEQMKRFLYGELSEEEAQDIEEQLFSNSMLFYEIVNFENGLIDKYVKGKLEGEELDRFEQSLLRSDARREQVKNARALQRYITEQKKGVAPVYVKETRQQSLRARLAGLFGFQSPAMQYAMAILIVFLGVAGTWLLYNSYRADQELARMRSEQEQRERELQNKIVETEREIEILKRGVKEQEELKATLKQREEELSQLKRQQKGVPQNETIAQAVQPAITAIDVRGAGKEEIVKYSARYVTVRLKLSTEMDYQVYRIIEKERVLTTGKKIIDSKSGETYLMVTLPARSLVFKVQGIDRERGREKDIGEYRLEMQKKERSHFKPGI